MMTVLMMSVVLGQPLNDLPPPPSRLAQLQPPPLKRLVVEPPSVSYSDLVARAVANQRPLVTFVGVKSRAVVGCEVFYKDFMPGFPAECLVVSIPYSDGELRWCATLKATASDHEVWQLVLQVIERNKVQASPLPFSALLRPKDQQIADDDLKAAGPWPKEVVKLKGLVRYKRARFTQEIAVTNDRDRITPVPRLNLARKWHQSGGMEDVTDYRSDVYKFIPVGGTRGIGNIAVLNSFGHFQNNRGYVRSYPDGTVFMDVLSYRGKVFEHRERSKDHGTWKSRVVYKDESARPPGYKGLTLSCASCHDEAGSGGYATGLVPGGDTVLSDPFPELES